jgi:hypothetical protein
MATFTASLLNGNVVKAHHEGVIAVASNTTLAATATASSILLLARVPHGATLLDYWVKLFTGGVAQTLKLGTSATPSGILALTSLSQTYSISTQNIAPTPYGIFNQGMLRHGAGDLLPARISLSDDVVQRWVWVQGTLGVAISASAFCTFMLFYTMDGMLGRATLR